MSQTHRAVRIHAFGEPAEALGTEEVPAPRPGPGEVLLRMRARPVNPSDLSLVRGRYGELPALPATPGLEGLGEVVAHGPGAGAPPVGARVVPLAVAPGTWAELMTAPADGLVAVPDAVSDAAGAQLVVNPLSAWVLVTEELAVPEGGWLLQSAAGSTLGRVVIQLARARGFRTIDVVRREEQADELRALGAEHVLVDGDDLPERVRTITGGDGVRHAMDAVGGPLGARMAASLGTRGTLVSYGRLSQQPTPLDTGLQIFRGTTVRGFWLVQWFRERSREHVRAAIDELLGLMADGVVDPPVEATYDLADVRDAAAHAERPGRSGKVILTG